MEAAEIMKKENLQKRWTRGHNVYISNNVNSQLYYLIILIHTDATTMINQMLVNANPES